MPSHLWKATLAGAAGLAMLLTSALSAAPPARPVKIAVLTPGLSFGEVLSGFRDGLGQLG